MTRPVPVPFAAPEQALAAALACPTISAGNGGNNAADAAEAFRSLRSVLEAAFPRLHAGLRREAPGPGHALLYRWEGSEAGLRPWAILAHQDVVGVAPESLAQWSYPPFGGVIAEGHVWGRGALDMKSSLLGAMQAVEDLLAEGFVPRRSLLLVLGDNEEVGGEGGAAQIAALLRARGERLALTLDEGGLILAAGFPGVRRPVALIGIAQRGELVLRLTATAAGGHSGMPERAPAILRLARALDHLARRGLPGPVEGAPRRMLLALSEAASSGSWRLAYRVAARFGRRGARLLHRTGLASLTQTTLAVTRLEAGSANNVVPHSASAVLDIRLRPGDDTEHALRMVEEAIATRFGIRMEALDRIEPSHESPAEGPLFDALAGAARAVVPDAVVAPCLSPNDSDSKHFADLAEAQYRFVPVCVNPAELAGIHAVDERIAIEAYRGLVHGYRAIIRAIDTTEDPLPTPPSAREAASR
jgi:carboxypeptidase PM20D1